MMPTRGRGGVGSSMRVVVRFRPLNEAEMEMSSGGSKLAYQVWHARKGVYSDHRFGW